MNILNKVTLQNMKKSRTRTVVTIIGVILSTTMIVAVATFGTSLLHFLINGSIAKYGGWHVGFLDVDASFAAERIQDKEAVSAAYMENIGYSVLEGGKSPEKPYLFLAGFDEETFDMLPVTLVFGRMPQNSGEVLIPSHVAVKGGVRFAVGDTITLITGERIDAEEKRNQHDPFSETEKFVPQTEKSYTIVGICERPGFEEHSAPGYTLITKKSAEQEADSLSLFVTLKHPRQAKNYGEETAGEGNFILNDSILRFMGVSENKLFNMFLYTAGFILIAIIMVGSIFLIYNSFQISINERIRQFGILSSIGATERQLRNSVLFEGVCIGAGGIPIGILTGIGSIGLVIPVVSKNFKNIIPTAAPLTLTVSAPAIFAAAVVSLITILISAYLPAKKAASLPVMESIRQSNEIKTELKMVKTSKLVYRICGLEGTLALKNFKRNKKRYHSIILSLVLSVVLFVSGNAFRTTLQRISERYRVSMDYDILFSAQNMEDRELFPLYDRLKTAKEVYESSCQFIFSYFCAVEAGDFSEHCRESMDDMVQDGTYLPMEIQFIEDAEYLDFIKDLGLSAEEYTGRDAKMIAVAKKRIVQEDGSRELFDLFSSRSMTFSVAPEIDGKPAMEKGQTIPILFVDTYPVDPPPKQSSDSSYVFMIVAPDSRKETFETPDHVTVGMGFLSNHPSESVMEMETVLQSIGLISEYTLYNLDMILEQSESMMFVIEVFTSVFVMMISLIAVANVFNTISTNIKLRRRELAMLRSIGMSDRDFQKMMHFECFFYGMKTLLFGLPIAGIFSWLIYKGMAGLERVEDFYFVFPWGSMIISIFGVLFIVFITMLYSISKIKKENIMDALRDDMT